MGSLKCIFVYQFWLDLMKNYGGMKDYSRKIRLKVCHSYRLCKPLEGMSWNLTCSWSNHHRSVFCGLSWRPQNQTQPVSKSCNQVLQIKIYYECVAGKPLKEVSWKLICRRNSPESLCSNTEQSLWVMKWNPTICVSRARSRYSNRTVTLTEHLLQLD